MQDFLIELVKNAGADAWEITDVENYGWEFYFIKHKLDQNRVKRTEHTSVKLFKKSEDGKFLGSAVSEIAPTASREEAQAILDSIEKAKARLAEDIKEDLAADNSVKYPISFNGKTRFFVDAPASASPAEVEAMVRGHEKTPQYVGDMSIAKVIVVPGRIVNVVLKK